MQFFLVLILLFVLNDAIFRYPSVTSLMNKWVLTYFHSLYENLMHRTKTDKAEYLIQLEQLSDPFRQFSSTIFDRAFTTTPHRRVGFYIKSEILEISYLFYIY